MVTLLACCIRGALGKGTLRTYPSMRVPTAGATINLAHFEYRLLSWRVVCCCYLCCYCTWIHGVVGVGQGDSCNQTKGSLYSHESLCFVNMMARGGWVCEVARAVTVVVIVHSTM